MGSLMILGMILFVIYAFSSSGGTSRARSHRTNEGSRAHAAIHEGRGHAAVGRYVGATVGRAWINDSGSGAINIRDRRNATTAEKIAVCLGGALAEGASIHSSQARGDKRNIDAIMREDKVPRSHRKIVMGDAEHIARRGISSQSGYGKRIEQKLLKNGRA